MSKAGVEETGTLKGIKPEESVHLVNCLLRLTISHTAFLRGMFPANTFVTVHMRNLAAMHLKKLRPVCRESARIMAFINEDATAAVSSGFLHALHFCVCQDYEGKHVIEQYTFSFAYPAMSKEGVPSTISDECGDVGSDEVEAASESRQLPDTANSRQRERLRATSTGCIRAQIVALFERLVKAGALLEAIPEEHFVAIKLEFAVDAPDTCLPKCSSASSPRGSSPAIAARHDPAQPCMRLGEVDMGHVKVSVSIHRHSLELTSLPRVNADACHKPGRRCACIRTCGKDGGDRAWEGATHARPACLSSRSGSATSGSCPTPKDHIRSTCRPAATPVASGTAAHAGGESPVHHCGYPGCALLSPRRSRTTAPHPLDLHDACDHGWLSPSGLLFASPPPSQREQHEWGRAGCTSCMAPVHGVDAQAACKGRRAVDSLCRLQAVQGEGIPLKHEVVTAVEQGVCMSRQHGSCCGPLGADSQLSRQDKQPPASVECNASIAKQTRNSKPRASNAKQWKP